MIKTFLYKLFFGCIMLFVHSSIAQCPVDIWVRTQTDVDSFPIKYPDCEHATFVLIWASESILDDPITDLTPMSQLKTVSKNLTIRSNLELTSLEGLGGIDSIHGDLSVSFNGLRDLKGLDNLKYVGNNAAFGGNSRLKDLRGFPELTTFQRLNISGDSISNLTGLESVLQVKFFGLQTLPLLNSLDGISTEMLIDSILVVRNCPKLSNINLIPKSSNLDSIAIINCPALETCAAPIVCDFISRSSSIRLSDNLGDCMDLDTLEAACALVNTTHFDVGRTSLYPNPASGIVRIDCPHCVDDIYHIIEVSTGRMLIEFKIDRPSYDLDISDVPAGIYIITSRTNPLIRKKLIVY